MHKLPKSLVYVEDSMPGYTRQRRGRGFEYFNSDGQKIKDTDCISWCKSLVLPPAWEDVWIAPVRNAHLLATGRDAKSRKQYRYHPDWATAKKTQRFKELTLFAKALPGLREQVNKDMRQHTMSYSRVVAASVYLLDLTHLRIGNTQYSKNGHYGLTTLKDKHLDVNSHSFELDFIGKSGKNIHLNIQDERACRFLKRCHELPGQQLLQYVDEGKIRKIGSEDINDYLSEYAGDFTAKTFRTWAGTLVACEHLSTEALPESENQYKKACVAAVKAAAAELNNTVATARAHYVAPAIFDAFVKGDLHKVWQRYRKNKNLMSLAETRCAALLELIY